MQMGPSGNKAEASTSLVGSYALTDPTIIDAASADLRGLSWQDWAGQEATGAPYGRPADRRSASGCHGAKAQEPLPAEVPAKIGSNLPPALVSAYLTTRYQVDLTAVSFELRVGARSCELLDLYEREGCRTAAFVTAWNPRGERLEDAENSLRNRALLSDIAARGLPSFTGEGRGENSGWPPEASLLALGLLVEEAAELGRRYEQNAIVWASDDATPMLVLLR